MSVDLSTLALVIGTVTSLAAVAFGVHTWRRYKDMPLSREQMLEQRVDDLEATVRILQERIRELEDELEQYKNGGARSVTRGRMTKPKAKPEIKRLTGGDLVDLREVLLDTYTSHSQWESLLGDIDRQIDAIATGESLSVVVGRVLTRANNEGWIDDLIKAAVDGRPDLAALKTLAGELAKVLA